MRRTIGLAVFATMLAAALPSLAQDKPILAVMEIEDKTGKFEGKDLEAATEYLSTLLIASGKYSVVEKGRQEAKKKQVVKDLKRETYDACYDDKCRIELGRALAADTLLSCSILGMGKTCTLTCRMVPLEKEVAARAGIGKFECSLEAMSEAIEAIAAQLSGALRNGADAGLTGGRLVFEEDFSMGLENFIVKSDNWKIVDQRLYTGDRPNANKGVWLKDQALPRDVRIEFTATPVSGKSKEFQGDVKCEFGGTKSEHADGYIIILGGWNNALNTIARKDEHVGRLVVDSKFKVTPDTAYRFQVVRLGKEIRWFLDGDLLLVTRDEKVLTGGAFGFNNWNSRVYFDNLKVFAL